MSHGGLLSLLVFFTFVVIGVLFLLQHLGPLLESLTRKEFGDRLILGTVIDTYMDEAQEELRSKRVKQSKGLMRAFSVLDYRNEGAISRLFRWFPARAPKAKGL